MSRSVSPSTGRRYGVAAVTRVWGVARATLYRHRLPPSEQPRRRPGPAGAMPDADLVEMISAVITASPFHGEGYRKVWARLRFAGIRTSRGRVLRLMREHGLLAPSQKHNWLKSLNLFSGQTLRPELKAWVKYQHPKDVAPLMGRISKELGEIATNYSSAKRTASV